MAIIPINVGPICHSLLSFYLLLKHYNRIHCFNIGPIRAQHCSQCAVQSCTTGPYATELLPCNLYWANSGPVELDLAKVIAMHICNYQVKYHCYSPCLKVEITSIYLPCIQQICHVSSHTSFMCS